jgi:hypothetical protein
MNTTKISSSTVAITDFKMQTPAIAKVMISFTGRQTKETIRAALLDKLDRQAAPIDNSFRIVKANSLGGVAVGFLRAQREVRVVDNDKQLRASYRALGSNIMMDQNDKSLWEVKDGAGGKYLARHGNEDLSELIQASVHRRGDIPGIRALAMAKAARHELVAFVSPSGDMDYGFAIGTRDDAVRVVSHTTQTAQAVDYNMVTFMAQVPVPKSVNRRILEAGISREDKNQQIEYYRQLFSYAPEYLAEVIEMVNNDTVA